jgi:hypothetical protein
MKDIALEDFIGMPSIFHAAAGRAAQLDRHIHSLQNPGEIPELGDLSQETIARYFGVYLDFWRFTLKRQHWKLHAMFLSRYFFKYYNNLFIYL